MSKIKLCTEKNEDKVWYRFEFNRFEFSTYCTSGITIFAHYKALMSNGFLSVILFWTWSDILAQSHLGSKLTIDEISLCQSVSVREKQ